MTTVYGLANCDTCRKARNWLDRFGLAQGSVFAFAAAAMTAMLFASSGCTSSATRTGTGKAMILPAGAQVMVVPENQAFLMAGPISNPLPDYPSGLAGAASGSIDVCAEFVVEADGSVHTVTPLFALPECPLTQAALDPKYVAAVETAVLQWQFFAAATCTFPAGVARNDACEGEGIEVTPIAIKLAYVFTFRVEHGRASVASRAANKRTRA